MDYKNILLKTLLNLGLLALLTACGGPNEEITIGSIKVSPEPLRIIGTPPSTLYYDAQFEFEFGAAGGDGEYRYRYIQNPVSSTGEKLNVDDNPVEMSIEVLDSAKPLFKLKALPELPDDISYQELNDRKYTYQIELTDGKNTIKRDFEFTLKKNKLQLVTLSIGQEGSVNTTLANNLLNQLKSGQTRVCQQITERTFEKSVTDKGETVYPYVFQVFAEANVASRTELFYRFKSGYSENELERSDRNIGFLRPGVDYIEKDRSIVLEPGNATCVGFIEILDDAIIEGDEEVRLEFFNRVGGAVDFIPAAGILEVRDNELLPNYETTSIVRNKGDKIVVPIKLPAARTTPVSITVSVDQEKTTAPAEDFILEPVSGVVTINAGELEASYSVTLAANEDTDVSSVYKDKKIYIKTDLDKIIEVDPFLIEINQWPLQNALANEIIASSADNEEVVNFSVDEDGIVTALIAHNGLTDTTTRLKSFYRDASVFQTTNQDIVPEFAKPGMNIVPKAIATHTESNVHTLAVVANVNGLYGDVFRGGIDFAVLIFTRNRGESFVLDSVKQYGTEGDDFVSNAIIRNNALYVYGKTDGQDFEGQPTNETNNGGQDGFIYSIDLSSNSYSWARFIGTNNNDSVKDIDAGNRDIVALVSTTNSDEDAYVKKISARTGLDQEEVTVSFTSPRDDKAVGIRFDATANNYRALLNSSALLSEINTQTPSLSEDAQILAYDSENQSSGVFSVATSQDDEATAFENMPDKQHFVVGGGTEGVFENNQAKGTSDSDAFISIFESELQTSTKLLNTIQFGTIENDQVIAIKPVSNTKFLVLWKEHFSQNPEAVYRISAFSIDGNKLSRDPD